MPTPTCSRLLLLVCVSALACGDAEPDVRYSITPLGSGGRRVANDGRAAWSPDMHWSLEEDLRLGATDGDGPDVFSVVACLGVDADGRIHVLENLAQEVRVFDANGRFVHRLGGKGRGPGEFIGAERFFIDPAGNVLVVDLRAARYTLFGRDGNLDGTWSRRVRGAAPVGGFLSDGQFVDWGVSFPEESSEVVAGRLTLFEPFRLSAQFDEMDTLPPIAWQREMTPDGRRPQVFFAARLVGFQDADGEVWFANTRRYEVVGRSLEGDTALIFTLPTVPAELTEADRQVVRTRTASRPGLAAQYLLGLPRSKPVIAGIVGDGAGYIYVAPVTREVPPGGALDVFRDTGEFLGRLDLPSSMWMPPSGPIIAATREHLYYVVTDEFDVPHIVRLRIVRPQ